MIIRAWISVVGLAGFSAVVSAQSVAVNGVAYDSLRNAPLTGAFIAILGTDLKTTSDSLGRFHFGAVIAGAHTFAMQHEAFYAIGLSGTSKRITITTGVDTVRLAVPSLAFIWRTACGNTPLTDATAMVFGTVQNAAGDPVSSASVDATWVDAGFDKKTGVTQTRYRLDASSDSTGGYALCGVPASSGIQLQAAKSSGSSGAISVLPTRLKVSRVDLRLGTNGSGEASRGIVVGTLTAEGNRPVADARVIVDGTAEVRSDNRGYFVVRSVATGTRQIEVLALGMTPMTTTADVVAGDTARVAIELHRVVTLDSVRVIAPLSVRQLRVDDINGRRKTGLGYFRDSTEIGKYPTLDAAFNTMPSVHAVSGHGVTKVTLSGGCEANVWLDGVHVRGQIQLADLYPDDVAAVEVYPRMLTTPSQFLIRSGPGANCGSIVVWTKRAIP